MKYTIKQVNPAKIQVENGFNPRTEFGDVEDLAADIAINGLLQPLIIREVGKAYWLVDGQRRLMAINDLIGKGNKIKTVPCRVVDVSDEQALVMALATGTGSKPLTLLEEAEVVRRFYRVWNWDQRDIATNLGKSQGWVSTRVKIGDATKSVHDAIASGELTITEAIEVSRNPAAEQDAALEERRSGNGKRKYTSRKPKRKEVVQFVQQYIQGWDGKWSDSQVVTMLLWAVGDRDYDSAVKAAGTEPEAQPAPEPVKPRPPAKPEIPR